MALAERVSEVSNRRVPAFKHGFRAEGLDGFGGFRIDEGLERLRFIPGRFKEGSKVRTWLRLWAYGLKV